MTMNTDQPTPAPGTDQRPQPRIAAGPLGRALYLSDLVRWLMHRHDASRDQVVNEHLCPVLVEHSLSLYRVGGSGGSMALPADWEWFRSGSGNREVIKQTGSIRVLSRGIGQPGNPRPMTPSLGRGLEGAVAWLRWAWGNMSVTDSVMEHNQTAGAYLAVSEADARRCWGWGADAEAEGAAAEPASVFPLADSAALVAYRKAQKAELVANGKPRQGVPWKSSDPADNQLNVLHRWYETLGKNTAAAQQIAVALECSRQAVEAALVKPWDPAKGWTAPVMKGIESP